MAHLSFIKKTNATKGAYAPILPLELTGAQEDDLFIGATIGVAKIPVAPTTGNLSLLSLTSAEAVQDIRGELRAYRVTAAGDVGCTEAHGGFDWFYTIGAHLLRPSLPLTDIAVSIVQERLAPSETTFSYGPSINVVKGDWLYVGCGSVQSCGGYSNPTELGDHGGTAGRIEHGPYSYLTYEHAFHTALYEITSPGSFYVCGPNIVIYKLEPEYELALVVAHSSFIML